jgi:uncharacterized protein (TIGR02302 family)
MTELAPLPRRLAARRTLARLAILFERVWPAIWPPLGVVGLFVVVAFLNLPSLLPAWLHIAMLAGFGGAALTLLALGLRGIAAPNLAAADRRLEIASGLTHRPLSVLSDRLAVQDAASQALWQAHVARAAAQIRHLRIGWPKPGLARRDRRALRCGLVVALIAALAIANRDAPSRLAAAMEPSLPGEPAPPAAELQVWITPPPYTRLAPMFLKSDTGPVSVPQGSHLTASLTGGERPPTMTMGGATEAFRALDRTSFQADMVLTQGGHLSIARDGRALSGWNISVVADRPPTVSWADKPGKAALGQQTRLPWLVSDDYGVALLQAELRLDGRAEAPPVIITIPLPGGAPKTARGVNQQDLTAHPWAGLPITGRLVARDTPNQIGVIETAAIVLPERPFHNPIARILIQIRKGLSLHPDDREEALAALDGLLVKPDEFAADAGGWLNLSGIYSLMVHSKAPDMVEQAQGRLWELALHLEEGRTENTARALEAARQAAKEALDQATREPTEANRQALEERLKELQQAIDRHMQAMLEEAMRNNQVAPMDPDARPLTNQDLSRMADRAREAAKQGRMDEARKRMDELERMLDRLRNARGQTGKEQQANNQRKQRGRQQMSAVQDMVGRQGGLLDHSESRVDQTMRLNNSPPTTPRDPKSEREADRRVQQALRRSLGELMQQFGELTGEVPPGLTEADQAMRESGQQLGEGRDKAAGDAQQSAIAALQKGAREMGRAMAQAMARQQGAGQSGGEGEPDEGEGEGDGDGLGMTMPGGRSDRFGQGTQPGGPPDRANPAGRDPLGRRLGQGSSGADESEDDSVPEERERLRMQAIQEELRRRGAERERPRQELDYIDRLLKQF